MLQSNSTENTAACRTTEVQYLEIGVQPLRFWHGSAADHKKIITISKMGNTDSLVQLIL